MADTGDWWYIGAKYPQLCPLLWLFDVRTSRGEDGELWHASNVGVCPCKAAEDQKGTRDQELVENSDKIMSHELCHEASVYLGCYNKISWWVAHKQQNVFLIVLEVGKSKIKASINLGYTPHRCPSPDCNFMVEEWGISLGCHFKGHWSNYEGPASWPYHCPNANTIRG